jgi:hypothetical protein
VESKFNTSDSWFLETLLDVWETHGDPSLSLTWDELRFARLAPVAHRAWQREQSAWKGRRDAVAALRGRLE